MSYREGARAVASVAVAVGGFGVSFGLLAREAGLSPVAAIVMSVTVFGGSAQFAAVSVLDAGGTVAAAVAAALLLNARYVPIGLSVAPQMRGPVWLRALQAQTAVDEAWAASHLGGGRYDLQRLVGAGVFLGIAWTAGTAVGALGGRVIGDPEALGLDAAFPALFLALLAGQVHDRRGLLVAVLGGGLALLLVPLVPPGVPIVAAAVACLLGLRR